METGTLDFNDLMDTDQDAFPGFEIARFSPINASNTDRQKGDDDDDNGEILKTPEHEPGDKADSDDENKNDSIEKSDEKHDTVNDDVEDKCVNDDSEHDALNGIKPSDREGKSDAEGNEEAGQSVSEELNGDGKMSDSENDTCNNKEDNTETDELQGINDSETISAGKTETEERMIDEVNDKSDTEGNDVGIDTEETAETEWKVSENDDDHQEENEKSDDKNKLKDDSEGEEADEEGGEDKDIDDIAMEGEFFTVEVNNDDSENDDEEVTKDSDGHDAEPAEKKYKKTPKMYMLPLSKRRKIQEAEETDERVEEEDMNGDDHKDKEEVMEKRKPNSRNSTPKKGKGKRNGVEDDSNQQSFLSFLNLKPGQSKPDEKEKVEEEVKQKEFFSRKRLRTRKAVNYVEDVRDDSDEDYSEEEEPEYDHVIESGSKRRRSSSGSQKRTPIKVNALQTYAKALNSLVPSQNIAAEASKMGINLNVVRGARPSPAMFKPRAQTTVVRLGGNLTRPIAPRPASMQPVQLRNQVPLLSQNAYQNNVKGLFECGICGVFYNTAELFIKHQQETHSTEGDKLGRAALETFRCEVCQFVLTNRFAYLEHKRMKHTKQQFQFSCTKCPKTFNYLVDLQKHKETCKEQQNSMFYCTQCPAKYTAIADLQQHQKNLHSRQFFTCQNRTCAYRAQTQNELKAHVQKVHMVSELFPCNVPRCARIFSTKEQLVEHQKTAHGNDFIVQYQCMECKGCYSSKTLLAEHQYLHTTDKLRKCDICSREFSSLSQLLKHKDVHVCKGTAQCKLCHRWCFDDTELANHICKAKKQMHSTRLYFCDVCKKDFKSDEKMFAHRKDHYKYFQCGTCFWEADTEDDYFEHREIHSLYTCRICCDEFETEQELETHKRAHDFYVKTDTVEAEEEEGDDQPVMYLCPNVLKSLST